MWGQDLLFSSSCSDFGSGARWNCTIAWHTRHVLVNPLCYWSSSLQHPFGGVFNQNQLIKNMLQFSDSRRWNLCKGLFASAGGLSPGLLIGQRQLVPTPFFIFNPSDATAGWLSAHHEAIVHTQVCCDLLLHAASATGGWAVQLPPR